jgi:hypothetical protein
MPNLACLSTPHHVPPRLGIPIRSMPASLPDQNKSCHSSPYRFLPCLPQPPEPVLTRPRLNIPRLPCLCDVRNHVTTKQPISRLPCRVLALQFSGNDLPATPPHNPPGLSQPSLPGHPHQIDPRLSIPCRSLPASPRPTTPCPAKACLTGARLAQPNLSLPAMRLRAQLAFFFGFLTCASRIAVCTVANSVRSS